MDQMETILTLFSFLLVFSYLVVIKRLKKTQYKVDDLLEENTEHQQKLKTFTQQQKNPLGNLLYGTKEAVTIHFDKSGKILYSDKNMQNLLGYSAKEFSKQNMHTLLTEKVSTKDPLETSIIQRLFSYPKLYPECETELQTKSGQKIWISWTNRIIYDKKNSPKEVWAVGFDITHRKNLETELKFLASIDPETGILNRQAFLQTGTRELRRSIRYKHDLSILLIQLTYHGEEDLSIPEREKFLKEITTQCKKTLRDVDYLGRIGEVDLGLLLPETNFRNIPFLQKRLEQNIAQTQKELHFPVTIKFGLCGYKNEKSIDEMIMKAYNDMNKTKGRKNANRSKK